MCIKRKKSISFLLGAGFSANAGYPTGKKLGEKILNTEKNNILSYYNDLYFHSDSHEKYIDFLLELLSIFKKYNDFFNYEKFYDFIKDTNNDTSYLLNILSEKIKIKGNGESISNTMNQIDEIYNLLVSMYIKETIPNALCQNYYKNFVDLIMSLKQDYIINVHTLNHDLLFEDLLGKGNYTDGFTKSNSDYYENIYHGTIPFYANDYRSSNIRLYKLHGSIDYYRALKSNQNPTYVKLSQNVYRKNVSDKNGRCIYDLHPDFLTGINFKQTRYNENFYNYLHSKFISNLASADKLIIIGYSGNDDGINKHLNKLNKNATCFVLDYSEEDAKKVIDRIGLCDKGIRCYAVKSKLENLKESDFEESTYRN